MNLEEFGGELIKDPYEFATNDSNLWLTLLINAREKDRELFYILNYLRDVGATLEKDNKFGYIIKPIIDPNGIKGWHTQKQYNEEKQYLVPYNKTLIALLKSL